MSDNELETLARVALGEEKADLAILGGDMVNVYTGELLRGWSVATKGKKTAKGTTQGQAQEGRHTGQTGRTQGQEAQEAQRVGRGGPGPGRGQGADGREGDRRGGLHQGLLEAGGSDTVGHARQCADQGDR